jgi:hypothetical protein
VRLCGEALLALGRVQAQLAAAWAELLRRFDAADAHDGDGYGSSSAWLAARAGMSKQAARAAVRQNLRRGRRPARQPDPRVRHRGPRGHGGPRQESRAEDDRTEQKRFYDALQLACALL